MFTYQGFFVDRNAMVTPNFFNQNSFNHFLRYFEKKMQKKDLFSFMITILDHTLYGKVIKIIIHCTFIL